jgi:hypothetical protein
MHPHDKGWHEVNWTPLEEPEPQYDDDAVATVLMTIICIGVIACYFWEVLS